jgi:adenylate cyclase class 1
VLGRKLYAAFERKAGKIEIIYRGITHSLYESHLSIHRLTSNRREFWVAFGGIVNEKEVAQARPLKRAYSLIELIAWCYFNKMLTHTTVTALYTYGNALSDREYQHLVETFERIFSDEPLEDSTVHELRQPARIASIGTFINVGVDPFAAHTRRGDHLTSNRTDSLRFGGRLENLIRSIDQVIITTWQEVLTFRYQGLTGLFKCLQDYIQWSPPSQGRRPPPISPFSFSCYRGGSIAHRLEELFDNILDCFYNPRHMLGDTHYILAIEWDYYILRVTDDALDYNKAGDFEQLCRYLSQPSRDFKQVVFDPQTLNEEILPLIYADNRSGVVQFFYYVKDKTAHVFILDERGSLFVHQHQFYDATTLITHYEKFFRTVHQRMQFLHQETDTPRQAIEVEFNRLERDIINQWQCVKQARNPLFKPQDFVSLQVIGERVDDETVFQIYCEDREYSTLEHGVDLFRHVARDIIGQRRSGERYPVYITDIDLSRSLLGSDDTEIQTVHFLNYKKSIEARLLEAMD